MLKFYAITYIAKQDFYLTEDKSVFFLQGTQSREDIYFSCWTIISFRFLLHV